MRESRITRAAVLVHSKWNSTAKVVERAYVLDAMPHPWAEVTVTVEDGCQYTHVEGTFEGAVDGLMRRGYQF